MTLAVVGGLILLALIDSTSVGTLVLPLLLLVQPRTRHAQLAVYVTTITAFYLGLGLALLLAGATVRDRLNDWSSVLESTPAYVVQVAVGAGLVVLSYALDPKYRDRFRVFRRRGEAAGPGRHTRWRSRLLGPDASLGATATVALGAGLVEAASMLPYLAAIGTITALQLPTAGAIGLLAGYVVVMSLPMLLLWGLRTALGDRATARLERLAAWFDARSATAISWTVGIVGVLLLLNGLPVLIGRLG